MKNETKSIESLSQVNKSPENKPATQRWKKFAFTIVMWILLALSKLGRLIRMIRSFVAWFREMWDAP